MTIERMGSEADLRIEAAKSKLNILLLGPGWPKKQLEERPGLGHCVCVRPLAFQANDPGSNPGGRTISLTYMSLIDSLLALARFPFVPVEPAVRTEANP